MRNEQHWLMDAGINSDWCQRFKDIEPKPPEYLINKAYTRSAYLLIPAVVLFVLAALVNPSFSIAALVLAVMGLACRLTGWTATQHLKTCKQHNTKESPDA